MSDLDNSATLRVEWLQYRSMLFDRDAGLPTLAFVIDSLRRDIEDDGGIAVLTFMMNAERQVEDLWGWQEYDRLITSFVRFLQGMMAESRLPQGVLCVPSVRSDEILFFVPVKEHAGVTETARLRWLKTLANSLDSAVTQFLAERLASFDRYCSHVGYALISYDDKVRFERLIYRGLQEARSEVFRRNASAEEHGAMVLRDILEKRDIVSVFQPIFDLVENRMAAAEALSRGPAGSGFENAESLFSLAEKTELVIPLERLCRERSLEEAGKVLWPHMIFLNMSPAAAADSDFVDGALVRSVARCHLDPNRIVIEITERTYAQHQDLFSNVIRGLRQEGFRVAVDDLGSGYSNLAALAEIKPEFLKFDHHFTREIQRNRIKQDLLGAILAFAMKMDTQVIAEGIENSEEFEALRRLGVPLGQGYFLGRPSSISTLVRPAA
ncbi:MAG: EAL domain-containing protein [Acidobacteria bacterium]|nr:EAL domain-containing protein [Acidobacteriota bacterium]MCG3191258.1 putative signaling protein [Thermoanaerobaculia bacterium]